MPASRAAGAAPRLRPWSRALHNYVGLYLLCFIWLFAGSGLLLNHHLAFAQFWSDREVTTTRAAVTVPAAGDDLAWAHHVMDQVGVDGEIQRLGVRADGDGGQETGVELQVVRAGRITDIDADFGTGEATIRRTQTNGWGVLHFLHTFTGVRLGQPELQRDWVLTRLWSLAIDAVSLGLLFLVVSGLYVGYPRWRRRPWAWACLGASVTACGVFVFALSGIY